MKWLFAVLVALNIIVFGGMVFSHMMTPQTAMAQAPAQPSGGQQAQPTVVQIHTNSPAPAPTDNRAPEPTTRPAVNAPINNTARRPAEAPKPNTDNAAAGIQSPNTACTASAIMPEDDYHRIKGLLSSWPHSATRVTERRNDNNANNARYRLSVALDGEAQSVQERLKNAGFTSSAISDGRVQLGVFNSEQQAERAATRARQAGFVPQIARVSNSGAEQSAALGESKMQLTFINVNDQAAAGINNVIGRYASLRRAPCRQPRPAS